MKALLCLSLLLAGYLMGQVSSPATAQAPMQGFNSDGSSFLYYPPSGPGGVGQYYGSDGRSGQIYQAPAPLGHRSPC